MKWYRANIWCMRDEKRIFAVSWVEDEALMIQVFGWTLWIGPNKPSFLRNKR